MNDFISESQINSLQRERTQFLVIPGVVSNNGCLLTASGK